MKLLLTIIVLSLLTIGSYFLLRELKKDLVEMDKSKEVKEMIVANNVLGRYYDENNKLQYKLTGKKVVEYTNSYGTNIFGVNILSFEESRVSWVATADKAVLSGDRNNLTLEKNIKVVQEPESKKPIYIGASVIYYDAKNNLITSDQAVTVKDGVMVHNSKNLHLNTKTEKIDFTNGIRAKYDSYQINEKNK